MAKRALLIGINRYKIPGADLRGCVNDVHNITDVLMRWYGFPKSGIKTLTDFNATTKKMREAIEKLIGSAKKGDVVLLHYSGHGSNCPDKNGDEADNRDEILCPTDLSWYDPLTDDWLRETLDGIPAGVNLTTIMDCCHSGSNTRAIQPPDAKRIDRFLPCPLDLMAAESGRGLIGRLRSRRRKKKRNKSKEVVTVNIPEVLITGCRDDQTSADAYIGGDYHGAMTNTLCRVIKKKRGKVTYLDLHAEMLKFMKGKYTQVPQLEGRARNLDRPFLEPV